MIFLLWLRRVGKFLWSRPLLLEAARHPDSWQTTSWANQLKTFIGDTFGMYKMSWSDQKKNVWWGRRNELKHFELHSSIGTKAAECHHLCESNNDASPRRASQSNRRFMSCFDVKSRGRKDETRGFFVVVLFDCHSLFLMFVCNIQRKMFGTTNSADQMKASIHFVGGTTNGLIRSSDRRKTVPSWKPKPAALRWGRYIFYSNDIKKKKKVFNTHASSPRRVQRQS